MLFSPPPPAGGLHGPASQWPGCRSLLRLAALDGAGIAGGPPGIGVTDEQWDLMQGVNVMQHVYVNRCVVPRMIARGGGSIVITASAAGLLTQVGSFTYAVTKAAAVACAEWLSVTHGADGIAVNCLCPQAVATNLGATSAKMRGDAPPAVEITNPDTPGVAGGDGVLTAEETAEEVLRCMADGEFLVLPHKEVRTYMERKATDTDRWITGMRRLNNAFGAQNAFYSRAILMCRCETINLPRQARDKR